MIEVVFIIFLLGVAVTSFILLLKKKKDKKEKRVTFDPKNIQEINNNIPNVKELEKNNNVPPQRYIKPTTFDMHTFSTPQPAAASLCNDKVLYPINGLGVEYGSKFPDNCPMLQFIQAP